MSNDGYLLERIAKIEEEIAETESGSCKKFWSEVLLKIVDLVDSSIEGGFEDIDLFELSLEDVAVFAGLWLDVLGKPLLLTPSQYDICVSMEKYKRVWSFCCRRFGKTTSLAVFITRTIFKEKLFRQICLSSTEKQGFVYDNVYDFIIQLRTFPFIMDNYFSKESSDCLKNLISLDNGSEAVRRTVGIRQKGKHVLGESASGICLDEIELYPEVIFHNVIKPILTSKKSRGWLQIIGTPALDDNPNLDKNWEEFEETDGYKTMQFDWKVGVRDGMLDKKEVLLDRERMPPDIFRMNYLADFPRYQQRFYTRSIFTELCDKSEHFLDFAKNTGLNQLNTVYDPKSKYVIGADFASYRDNFEVLVGKEVEMEDGGTGYQIVYWFEGLPEDKITPDEQGEILKQIFWGYGGEAVVFADGTRAGDINYILLDTLKNKGIPKRNIYCSDGAEKREGIGIVANTVLNEEMHLNHKRLLSIGYILPPKDKNFQNAWTSAHLSIDVSKQSGSGHLLFKKTDLPNDLAVANAYMSWGLSRGIRRKRVFYGVQQKKW